MTSDWVSFFFIHSIYYNITHRHKTAIVKKNKKICKKFTQNH